MSFIAYIFLVIVLVSNHISEENKFHTAVQVLTTVKIKRMDYEISDLSGKIFFFIDLIKCPM